MPKEAHTKAAEHHERPRKLTRRRPSIMAREVTKKDGKVSATSAAGQRVSDALSIVRNIGAP